MFALVVGAMGVACGMTSRSARSIAAAALLVLAVEIAALSLGGGWSSGGVAAMVLSQVALQAAYVVTVLASAILRQVGFAWLR